MNIQLDIFGMASEQRSKTELWCDWHGRFEPVHNFNLKRSKARCIKGTEEKERKRSIAKYDGWSSGGRGINPITGWVD